MDSCLVQGRRKLGIAKLRACTGRLGFDGQSERQVKQHNAERSAPLNDGRGFLTKVRSLVDRDMLIRRIIQ